MEANLGQLQEWQRELGISKKTAINYGEKALNNVSNRYQAMRKDPNEIDDKALRRAILQEIRAQAEAGLYRTGERMLYGKVFKKQARDKIQAAAKNKSKEVIAKEIAKRAALRWINAELAATIIGLIVVYLIMSIQYWGRNVMHYRWIPGLGFFDKFIYYGVNLILALAVIIIVALLVLIMLIQIAPYLALAYFGAQIF